MLTFALKRIVLVRVIVIDCTAFGSLLVGFLAKKGQSGLSDSGYAGLIRGIIWMSSIARLFMQLANLGDLKRNRPMQWTAARQDTV